MYLNFEDRCSEEKDSYLVLIFESTCDEVFVVNQCVYFCLKIL